MYSTELTGRFAFKKRFWRGLICMVEVHRVYLSGMGSGFVWVEANEQQLLALESMHNKNSAKVHFEPIETR